jgi:AraC-like DNA-binding protein
MISHASPAIAWPSRHLPAVVSAGVFPMISPGCNHSYSHKTVALHLHDYAGDMWIGKKRLRLQPGDITLSPSRIKSRYALPESGSHLCIHFLPPRGLAQKGALRLPLHYRLGPETVAVRERIRRITDYVRQAGNDPASPAGCAASASLQELLLCLHLQRRKNLKPGRTRLVEEALARLNRAIEATVSKPMLIGELAAGVGLSSEYVARIFAQRYGMTLRHHLLLRRIELARHLLVSSDLLVSEIGRQVGIPDPQYFNKQFRRVTGKSPLVYRRIHGHSA